MLYEAANGDYAESEDFGENWVVDDERLMHGYCGGWLYMNRPCTRSPRLLGLVGPHQAAFWRLRSTIKGQKAGVSPLVGHLSEFPYTLFGNPETPGVLYVEFGDERLVYAPNIWENCDETYYVPRVDALAVVVI